MSEPECTCPLLETTTVDEMARGEFSYVRGRPDGCPVHETGERRSRREAAMRAARKAL